MRKLIKTMFENINKHSLNKGYGIFDSELPILKYGISNKYSILAEVK